MKFNHFETIMPHRLKIKLNMNVTLNDYFKIIDKTLYSIVLDIHKENHKIFHLYEI